MKTKFDVKEKTGSKSVSINKHELIIMLNDALNDEWLTYYQSWIGAILMEGPLKNLIKPELFIHANQELNHALSLKSRLIQLGFTPNPNTSEQKKDARCQTPKDYYIEVILNGNLNNERKAIQRYQQIADCTFGKDPATYLLVSKIMDEELNHVRDIETWLSDIVKTNEVIVSNRHSIFA
jgi:bacterioferritin